MGAGWIGSLRYVPERGPQLAMWYGILNRWPAGGPFVQKHGPRWLMWYVFLDRWLVGGPFVQKPGPRYPMRYGFLDKSGVFVRRHGPLPLREHEVRLRGQTAVPGAPLLSAATDHSSLASMWYGIPDKPALVNTRLSENTDQGTPCGTGFWTDGLRVTRLSTDPGRVPFRGV